MDSFVSGAWWLSFALVELVVLQVNLGHAVFIIELGQSLSDDGNVLASDSDLVICLIQLVQVLATEPLWLLPSCNGLLSKLVGSLAKAVNCSLSICWDLLLDLAQILALDICQTTMKLMRMHLMLHL